MMLLYLTVISVIYICMNQSNALVLSAQFVPAWSLVFYMWDHKKAEYLGRIAD